MMLCSLRTTYLLSGSGREMVSKAVSRMTGGGAPPVVPDLFVADDVEWGKGISVAEATIAYHKFFIYREPAPPAPTRSRESALPANEFRDVMTNYFASRGKTRPWSDTLAGQLFKALRGNAATPHVESFRSHNTQWVACTQRRAEPLADLDIYRPSHERERIAELTRELKRAREEVEVSAQQIEMLSAEIEQLRASVPASSAAAGVSGEEEGWDKRGREGPEGEQREPGLRPEKAPRVD